MPFLSPCRRPPSAFRHPWPGVCSRPPSRRGRCCRPAPFAPGLWLIPAWPGEVGRGLPRSPPRLADSRPAGLSWARTGISSRQWADPRPGGEVAASSVRTAASRGGSPPVRGGGAGVSWGGLLRRRAPASAGRRSGSGSVFRMMWADLRPCGAGCSTGRRERGEYGAPVHSGRPSMLNVSSVPLKADPRLCGAADSWTLGRIGIEG